jgi:hypothetical protein
MIGRPLFAQTGPNCRSLGRFPEMESQPSESVAQPFDPGEFALRLPEIYNAPKAIVTKPRFMLRSQPPRTRQVRRSLSRDPEQTGESHLRLLYG